MTRNIHLQGKPFRASQPHSHPWRTHLRNAPQASERDKSKHQVYLLKPRRRSTWPHWPSANWCAVHTHLSHSFCLPNSPGSSHHSGRHNFPRELQYADHAHRGSVPVPWGGGSGTISHAKKIWHVWRGIFSRYPQQNHELHQRNRGGRTYVLTRQVQSVDAAQAPGTGRYRQ